MKPLNKHSTQEKMETLTQKDKIKAIRELTKEITASKEKALRYLKDSGIDLG